MNKLFCGMLLSGLVSLVGCKGFEECGKAKTPAECNEKGNFEASALPCKWNPDVKPDGACEKDGRAQGSGAQGSDAN